MAVSVIFIEGHGLGRQAGRTAQNGKSFPSALRIVSRPRCPGDVQFDVVYDDEIEIAVPVKVQEGATGAPPRVGRGLVAKFPVALVAVEDVLSPLCDKQVCVAIIVDIAGANALSPTGVRQSCFFGNVFELQAAQIMVEEVVWLRLATRPPLTRKISGRPSLS